MSGATTTNCSNIAANVVFVTATKTHNEFSENYSMFKLTNNVL
jgi:hypothetical protein